MYNRVWKTITLQPNLVFRACANRKPRRSDKMVSYGRVCFEIIINKIYISYIFQFISNYFLNFNLYIISEYLNSHGRCLKVFVQLVYVTLGPRPVHAHGFVVNELSQTFSMICNKLPKLNSQKPDETILSEKKTFVGLGPVCIMRFIGGVVSWCQGIES